MQDHWKAGGGWGRQVKPSEGVAEGVGALFVGGVCMYGYIHPYVP